jgi:multicomponent Na+:H+ antiporter subunit E
MRIVLLHLLLALIWASLQGEFRAAAVIQGLVLGAVVLWSMRRAIGAERYFSVIGRALALCSFFARELIIANAQLARLVLTPGLHQVQPAFLAVPLSITSRASITLLAALISLTPGTLSVDVSSDATTLYIHVIDARDPEAVVRQIKSGFERRILEVMGR